MKRVKKAGFNASFGANIAQFMVVRKKIFQAERLWRPKVGLDLVGKITPRVCNGQLEPLK